MSSLSQPRVPSSRIDSVTEVPGSRGSLVWVAGRATERPPLLLSARVKRTKVASRKKITSIKGMISMRAFFGPPALLPPDEPAMVGGARGRLEGGAFLLLDRELQRVGGVGDVVTSFFDAGVEDVVG